ncbi:MAG: IS4 family transposase [Acidocella sp.]|nr:IS4 family transposase [Acidocella sp.]
MRDQLAVSDWELVKALLPADWQAAARHCGALRRCRQVDSAETLLRLIFLHVAGGLSLRQTVVRAKVLGWATLSDVALLKRLRASGNWLESLCWGLWREPVWPEGLAGSGRRWRIVDASTVQEPGAVGIDWRVHYVVQLPSLACDFVSVTGVRGGETLCRIPVRAGDVLLADRGYSHRAGVAWVLAQGGEVIVRHQGANFPLLDRHGQALDLLAALRGLRHHQPGTWPVRFEAESRARPVWLHAVRKSAVAAQQTREELRRERGQGLQAATLELAEYVMVLTSLHPQAATALQVLALYRGRWQIELVFKRLKSLLGVGELAKDDADSARAWLQAKLLTALLLERLEREAGFFSPWGYPLLGTVALAGVSRGAGQLPAGGGSGAAAPTTRASRPGNRTKLARTAQEPPEPDATISYTHK